MSGDRDQLRVAYTATEADYVELIRALSRSARRRALGVSLALAASFTGGVLLLTRDPLPTATALRFGALLVGLVSFRWWRAPPRYVRRVLRGNPSQLPLTPQELTIGPAGLVYSGVRSRSTLGWGFVSDILESPNLLVLQTAPVSGFGIPRRAFETDADYEQFAGAARAFHREPAAAPAPPPITGDQAGAGAFELEFTLGERDYLALSRFAQRRGQRPRYSTIAVGLLLLAVFVCLLPYGVGVMPFGVLPPTLALLLVVLGSRAWWSRPLLPRRIRRLMRRHPHRFSRQPQQMRIGPRGLEHLTEFGSHHLGWDQVAEVAEDSDHVYLFTAERVAFVVPRRALADEDFERFVEQADAWRASARPPGRQATSSAPPDETAVDNPFQPPQE